METIEGLVLTFVLNALWQVPAVVLAGLIGERLLRRAPARRRHALWLVALAACLLLPTLSLLSRARGSWRLPPQPSPSSRTATGEEPAVWPGGFSGSQARPTPLPPAAAAAALALYGLAVGAHGIRLRRAWRQARRLARQAHDLAVPARLAPIVERCRAAFNLGTVAIQGSPEVPGPLTLGARRPIILLPSLFFASASPDQTTTALGHEMAHVRRRDYAVNLLGEILLLPIAFHPAARLVRRRLAEAREMACDEAAIETLIAPRAYARSLISLAAAVAGLPRPSITLGVHDAHTLEVRMTKILNIGLRPSPRRSRALFGTALLLLAGTAAVVSLFPLHAVAAQAGGDLDPFVGTWSGDAVLDDDGGKPVKVLDVEVRPDGQIVETWYRYNSLVPSGPTNPKRVSHPALSHAVSGNTLTFAVRVEGFAVEDMPPGTAEMKAQIELRGRDEAVYRSLSNSYFDAAKKRGEEVPPPPPPIAMKRGA